jgi:hypothetical protein
MLRPLTIRALYAHSCATEHKLCRLAHRNRAADPANCDSHESRCANEWRETVVQRRSRPEPRDPGTLHRVGHRRAHRHTDPGQVWKTPGAVLSENRLCSTPRAAHAHARAHPLRQRSAADRRSFARSCERERSGPSWAKLCTLTDLRAREQRLTSFGSTMYGGAQNRSRAAASLSGCFMSFFARTGTI